MIKITPIPTSDQTPPEPSRWNDAVKAICSLKAGEEAILDTTLKRASVGTIVSIIRIGFGWDVRTKFGEGGAIVVSRYS